MRERGAIAAEIVLKAHDEVEHYMKGFGHLMFETDYELHPRLNKLMGKGHYYVLEMAISDIREEMAGK